MGRGWSACGSAALVKYFQTKKTLVDGSEAKKRGRGAHHRLTRLGSRRHIGPRLRSHRLSGRGAFPECSAAVAAARARALNDARPF